MHDKVLQSLRSLRMTRLGLGISKAQAVSFQAPAYVILSAAKNLVLHVPSLARRRIQLPSKGRAPSVPWNPKNWAFDPYLYCDLTFTDPMPAFMSRVSLFLAELLE